MKPYCTQNDGDCATCSLVNYNRDCQNEPIWGGKREGAGRPSTGRKKKQYYVTDKEDMRLRESLKKERMTEMKKQAKTSHGFEEVKIYPVLAKVSDYEYVAVANQFVVAVVDVEPTTLNRYQKVYFSGTEKECHTFYDNLPERIDFVDSPHVNGIDNYPPFGSPMSL